MTSYLEESTFFDKTTYFTTNSPKLHTFLDFLLANTEIRFSSQECESRVTAEKLDVKFLNIVIYNLLRAEIIFTW